MRYQTHAKTRRQGSEEKAVKRGRAELRVGEKVGVSREDTQGRHSLGQSPLPTGRPGVPRHHSRYSETNRRCCAAASVQGGDREGRPRRSQEAAWTRAALGLRVSRGSPPASR